MKMTKRVLSIVMALVTLLSLMGIAAEAASVSVDALNLGYIAPTDAKGANILETVNLYGTYDYINFHISSKKNDTYFFYEIYSDKEYTQSVASGFVGCNKGEYSFSELIKLHGIFATKTYYMLTFAAKIYSDGSVAIDENSMCEFNVAVKRNASFNQKIVVLDSVKNTTNGPKVQWKALDGAAKYAIYRRSLTGTKWTKVGTVASSKRTFTDTSVKDKNGKYIYTVKAIDKNGTASRFLYSGLICLFAKTPVVSSIEVKYNNSIEVKWGKTSSGAKYDVYRKIGDGGWKKVKSNYTGTKYVDTSVKSGQEYTYTVRAKIATSDGTATSAYYQNDDKAVTYLRAPTLNKAVAVKSGVKVSWYSVSGSVKYTILRKNSDGSTGWKKVGTAKAGAESFIDKSASRDTGYIYTVRSEASGNKGSYKSAGVKYVAK